MKLRNNFAAFILTHGRPDKVRTIKALRREGYTGKIFIIIDDEDKTADEYRKRFPGIVHQFCKKEIAGTFDEADNFNERRTIVYARNASFEIAKKLGVRFFLQLDDDYTDFRYKQDEKFNYKDKAKIKYLDDLFEITLRFLEKTKTSSVAWAQGGDFIGGKNGSFACNDITLKRKCMNTFFCDTEKPFKFVGRINEDVNTYTESARRGKIFFTYTGLAINQVQTQANSGGMTDIYKLSGTYVKSFYSVIFAPSCVKIITMGQKERRIHHSVSWVNCCPLILPERVKK